MKYLFAVIALILGVASFGTYLSLPDMSSDVPVIYWVTDRNPARELQVEGFHQWLVKNGHVTAEGTPIVEMRLDTSNADPAKKVIQSVSGIASDIIDTGGAQMRLFQEMGVIADVTEEGLRLGFDPSHTYPAMESEITLDGRQYLFPCNVYASMLWYNPQTFEKYGQPLPPDRWTLEEFERLGKAFVEAANVGKRAGDRVFFLDGMELVQVYRSMGLASFNETLTASGLDDPRYVRSLELLHRWTYVDHLLPTPDDVQSFDAAQGYGGLAPQLFNNGNYAMVRSGRYMLIQFRKFAGLRLGVTEVPHGGYPTVVGGTRAAAVYEGGKHKDLAVLFLAYLASEDYNAQIVADADSLPPNPIYTRSEAYKNPPAYPGEHGLHEKFVDVMDIAIGIDYSPFVLHSVAEREVGWYKALYDNGGISAEEAARRTAQAINQSIANNLGRNPVLAKEYERRIELQRQIDERLASGRKVPEAWVLNPFYRRYYADQGLLEDAGGQESGDRSQPEPSTTAPSTPILSSPIPDAS